MAVNPLSNVAGTSIDVASTVSQLMAAERQPLQTLQSKSADAGIRISVLGEYKGLLSTLQSALQALQSPQNFNGSTAAFSKSGIASASLTSAAQQASYRMEVSALARKNIWNVSGFATAEAAQAWFDHADHAAVKAAADRVILQDATGKFVLSLTAKSSGVAAGFTVVDAPSDPAGLTISEFQSGQDARFSLNGVVFQKPSNIVGDALTGVTFNLESTTDAAITFTVGPAALSARPQLEAVVAAYNALHSYHQSATRSSTDPAQRGLLNSDFAVNAVMREVTNSFSMALSDFSGSALSGHNDLSALGLELNQDGQMVLSQTLLDQATGLQARLAQGVRIGYSGGKDLVNRIDDMLIAGGAVYERIESEKTRQTEINDRVERMQEKLVTIEARYKAQYAALNALLYDLSNTSTALKSALDGLTASNKD